MDSQKVEKRKVRQEKRNSLGMENNVWEPRHSYERSASILSTVRRQGACQKVFSTYQHQHPQTTAMAAIIETTFRMGYTRPSATCEWEQREGVQASRRTCASGKKESPMSWAEIDIQGGEIGLFRRGNTSTETDDTPDVNELRSGNLSFSQGF